MPAIPEFSVTQGRQAASGVRVTPSEEAIQTLQQGARNISRLTNEQAQYTRQAGQDIGRGLGVLGAGAVDFGKAFEQHQALQEISSMGPDFANMTNSIVDQMHAAIQSNDPEAIQKFRDNVETQLDTWQAKAISPGARAHAITQVDQLRNHILGTWLPGEMATAAGFKTKTDIGSMSNTFASVAANKPETLDSIIPMMGSQIDALVANHTLTPGSAEELKGLKQKAIGQVIGTAITSVLRGNPEAGIASNPDAVRQMLRKYGPLLSPQEQQHYLSEADAQDRVIKVQGRADEAEALRVEKKAYSDKMSDIITGMVQPDGNLRLGPTTVHDLIDAGTMPGRTPGEAEAAAKMVQSVIDRQKAGKDIVSDSATLASLQAKALSGDLTPTELYQNAPKLSQKDLANTYTMMERLEKSGSEFRNDSQLLKSTLNFGFGKLHVDPTIPESFAQHPEAVRFQVWFNAAASKAQREGKLPEFSTQLANAPDSFWENFKTAAAPNPGSGLAVPGPVTAPAAPSSGFIEGLKKQFNEWNWGGTR